MLKSFGLVPCLIIRRNRMPRRSSSQAIRHHMSIAYEGDEPVGFTTGIEMTHPDKGTEMFLYELEVAEALRRRGIGFALVRHLKELARERGCYGMWILTDSENTAALSTYMKSGGIRTDDQAMLSWDL